MPTLQERSLAVFPAGSNGEFNLPPELSTVITHGKGYELWDGDGCRFMDFSIGWGSVLVGHAHPVVVEAVTRQAPLGSNFAYVNESALLLAEEIVRSSPACDALRFCASGTEATMYCQRLARAFTGRPKIMKFEGAYHGANDIGVTSLFPTQLPDFPEPDPTSADVKHTAKRDILVAPFNDIELTRRIVTEHARELAAVIVEPLQRCTPPESGFLEGLRTLTRECEVLLIFDEVVTGFRLAYGGAQEYYGVVPDLVAYGKALGGGYPIGAFGGHRDIMDIVREDRMGDPHYVWVASTLGGNPISTAAARAALSVLSKDGTYEHLHALGRYLRDGMRKVLERGQITAQVIGDGPLAQVVFSDQPVRDYRSTQRGDKARGRAVMLGLFERGVFLNPMGTKLYLSIAHDKTVCNEFLDRFDDTLSNI
ncbi:MAG: aspartate aminotransferase family protein [Acidiferrobacterales bacterium]|nr:aspartate aminotransferase family protein [Acidiferrobacterales bacterium]